MHTSFLRGKGRKELESNSLTYFLFFNLSEVYFMLQEKFLILVLDYMDFP